MKVIEITEFDVGVVTFLQHLLPQLSSSAAPPSEELARKIVDSDSSRQLVAKEGEVVLGMLTIDISSGARSSSIGSDMLSLCL